MQVAKIPLFVAGSRLHRYRWAADRQLLIAKEVFFMEPANELVYIVDDEANVG